MNSSEQNTFGINCKRLFIGICLAIIPTGVSFLLVSNILYQLKTEFILANAQVGFIGGSTLWEMAISLLVFGPFLEKIGLKKASVGAIIGHFEWCKPHFWLTTRLQVNRMVLGSYSSGLRSLLSL